MGAGIVETLVQPPWRPIVADLSSGDFPEQSTNGTSNRQHENGVPAPGVPCDASDRDRAASDRDLAGLARDRAATTRDIAMDRADIDYARDGTRATTGAEVLLRAAGQRKRASDHRAQAAEHRVRAATDRKAAAIDREQDARDRVHSRADREALGRVLAGTEIDPLTGARARAAGLADLVHELDRSRRTGGTLVVAYVEAVGPPRVDDEGHRAADRLLQRVVTLIGQHLRSYDLIVRLGGDTFLCAISNITIPNARERFSVIAGALAGTSEAGALRTGFAELTADESATELIARAGSELISSRHG